MQITFALFVESISLGFGLAMDAFSVSIANSLNEPNMKKKKMLGIAGIFALFQAIMPLLGWVCIHTIIKQFKSFEKFIPWIALLLLAYIGIKMIVDGIESTPEIEKSTGVGLWLLIVQAIATSIDALSGGFLLANHNILETLFSVTIIAIVTFLICLVGVIIGKKAGSKLSGKANIFGGSILVIIGLEIFITGIF